MLTVADLCATLAGLLALVVDVSGGEVDDLTIAEPGHGVVGQPGDLVLGVGVESTEDAVALVRAAADAAAGGLVLRRSLATRRPVRDRARRDGLALVGLAEQASWAHVVWLLRGVIDRASSGDRRGDVPVQDDLFALADAAAALVDAPVTIEDAQSRVLAYSSRQDVTDPARVSTIVGRRVPDEVLASLRAQGVFRRLARSNEPVFVPADPNGTLPRLVVPVRAGGEWLGSIWAVVEQRPAAHLVTELVQTSSVVALHLLRLRAQADLSRRVAADRLRGVLSGSTAGADGWLPPGPWRVVCLGGDGGASRLLDLWESVSRRHSWNQPLLADLDGRAYAVVRDSDEPSPGTWGWLTSVVDRAHGESLELTARAGRTAHTVAELERSKAEALEVERVLGPTGATVVHEDVWAQVTVARAAATLREGDVLGPLSVLAAHDRDHGSDHLQTLAAWLDHPGAPGRAARSIHVHPNTMRYRMNRIADLAGLDFDDPLTRLALRLQLAALLGPTSRSGART